MSNILTELLYDLDATKKIERHEELPFEAGVLGSEGTLQARRMLANVYVLTGTIDPKDLAEDKTLSREADPYFWRGQCAYYGVWDKNDPSKILMAARLIRPNEDGVHSLQVHLEDFDERYSAALMRRDPSEIAELAAYVKAPELEPVASRLCSLYLIRELIRDSRDKQIKTWIFGLRPQLKTKYERLFGPGLDKRGEVMHLGNFKTPFLPYSVDVEAAWRRLMAASRLRIGSSAIARFVGMTNPAEPKRKQPVRANAARAKIAH